MSSSLQWGEFGQWDAVTERWVAAGNIAIVPYIMERLGRGVSRYLIARDRATFVAACNELGAVPSDLPRDRTAINIDGEYLMKAIVFCKRDAGRTFVGTGEPWKSTCPVCGLPFLIVAKHTVGDVVISTSAGCGAGHRWPV
jgi:hypothetical protein